MNNGRQRIRKSCERSVEPGEETTHHDVAAYQKYFLWDSNYRYFYQEKYS